MRMRKSEKTKHKVPVQDKQSNRRLTRQSFRAHKGLEKFVNENSRKENLQNLEVGEEIGQLRGDSAPVQLPGDSSPEQLHVDSFPVPFLELVPSQRQETRSSSRLRGTGQILTEFPTFDLPVPEAAAVQPIPPNLGVKRKPNPSPSSHDNPGKQRSYCIPDEVCPSGQKPLTGDCLSVRLFRPVDRVLPDARRARTPGPPPVELRLRLVKTTRRIGRKRYAKVKLRSRNDGGQLLGKENPVSSGQVIGSQLAAINNNQQLQQRSFRTPTKGLVGSEAVAGGTTSWEVGPPPNKVPKDRRQTRSAEEICQTPETVKQDLTLRNRSKVCRELDFNVSTCLEADEVIPFISRRSYIRGFVAETQQQTDSVQTSMRLPCVEQTRKYNAQSLTWNKQHTANKQGLYCYCGTDGVWYRGMVQCVRCSQWFHERCLAPRPRNMPIVQGDTHYLFVCSFCNYGVECLKRMPVSWKNFLHIALFDLSIKYERKHHDLKSEIYNFLLSNWELYQLPRQLNTLSEEQKKLKILSVLKTSAVFERAEGENNLWGLKELRTPPRGNFALKDGGFVSERNVLDDVIISPEIDASERVDLSADRPGSRCRRTTQSSQPISKHIRKLDCPRSLPKSKRIGTNLKTKRLKQPKVQKVQCREKLSLELLQSVSQTAEDPALFSPLLEKPLEVVKPLPFQIAKDLYEKGFPKVCVKFASVVPPKKEVVEQALVHEKSPKKRRAKPKEKLDREERAPKEAVVENGDQKGVLDSLIPAKPNYVGKNNPFDLGSTEALRKARNMLCNRKLDWTDLTKTRSRIRKRKYRLNIEESRRLWKRDEEDEDDLPDQVPEVNRLTGPPASLDCNGHTNGSSDLRQSKLKKVDPSVVLSGREKEIAGRCRSKSGDIRYFLKSVPET